jgi:hypothetical protein
MKKLFPMIRGCKSKNELFTDDDEQELEIEKNHYIECGYIHPNHSCLTYALTLWAKVLPGCFLMYAPIHLIPVLVYKRKMLFKDPLSVITGFLKNSMRSALFLGVFNSIMVAVMCMFLFDLGEIFTFFRCQCSDQETPWYCQRIFIRAFCRCFIIL